MEQRNSMITRLITVLLLAISIQSCNAETSISTPANTPVVQDSVIVEKTIVSFSTALPNKDLNLLLTITDPKDISVVRLFTSGNLGGRGEPLSEKISTSKINSELAFAIKNQTPFELPGLFVNLPIKSFGALPKRPLSADADTTYFDQWAPILKGSLKGSPEAIGGDSVLLTSSKYYVYAEAQIIDDILVGGFAVFSIEDGKLQLVSLINLL